MPEGGPGGMNNLQAKMLQPADTEHAPQSGEKTLEQKRNEIEAKLNGYFNEKQFKVRDEVVKLEKIIWPTQEDLAAYEKIHNFIDSDTLLKYWKKKEQPEEIYELLKDELKRAATFLKEATTFDSIKDKNDHHVRRDIERDLAALSRKDESYKEASSTYGDNRLSLRHMRNTYLLMDHFFHKEDFSPETQKMHDNSEQWSEEITTPADEEYNKRDGVKIKLHTKAYDLMDDEKKLHATTETAKYLIRFFDDLEDLSNKAA